MEYSKTMIYKLSKEAQKLALKAVPKYSSKFCVFYYEETIGYLLEDFDRAELFKFNFTRKVCFHL